MKIQLDYDKKIISIEDNVDLGDFVDKIRKIIPDWREWKLETKTEIIWNQPVIREYPPYKPYNPWWPDIWFTTDTNEYNSDYVNSKVQFEI